MRNDTPGPIAAYITQSNLTFILIGSNNLFLEFSETFSAM